MLGPGGARARPRPPAWYVPGLPFGRSALAGGLAAVAELPVLGPAGARPDALPAWAALSRSSRRCRCVEELPVRMPGAARAGWRGRCWP